MIAYTEGARSRFTPALHLSRTSFRLTCYISFQKITYVPASVQACGWPFLTFVVTKVNVRNVFYYKRSEYAHSPQ